MHIDDADTAAFKSWITPKLAQISDADPDVLADYVIALIRADESEEAVRQRCLESLPDFLHDKTAQFVETVLEDVRNKTYLPRNAPTTAKPFNPPTRPSANITKQPGPPSTRNTLSAESFPPQAPKRLFSDRNYGDQQDGRDAHFSRNGTHDRLFKQPRRGAGRFGRGGFGVQHQGILPASHALAGAAATSTAAPIPIPSAFGAFNPNAPVPSFLGLPNMGFPFPGMPPLQPLPPNALNAPPPFNLPNIQASSSHSRKRCENYDTKGFCVLGSMCPFEHGEAPIVVSSAEEYDPNRSLLAADLRLPRGGSHNARGSARSPSDRQGLRNEIRGSYMPRGIGDPSNTVVVVERIPDENLNEASINGFFKEFGPIQKLQLDFDRKYAIITFADHQSARRAYESPKAIFNNRFVRVYWLKQDFVPPPSPQDSATAKEDPPQDEEMLDIQEVEKKQAEAQRLFEEKARKRQEAELQKQEVEQKLQAMEEEKQRLLRELAAKQSAKASNGTDQGTALLDQLAALHDEATNFMVTEPPPYTRGGFIRGRGRFPTRGRGYNPSRGYRGSYRARGSFAGAQYHSGRCGVKRLDNRSKTVAITGIEAGSHADEVLRQHLLNGFDYDSIEQDPDHKDTQIVSFKERYIAEAFVETAPNIPGMENMTMTWVANKTSSSSMTQEPDEMANKTVQPASNGEQGASSHQELGLGDVGVRVDDQANENSNGDNAGTHAGDGDYDVADDEDAWMKA